MDDTLQRIAHLSLEQRTFLEQRLMQQDAVVAGVEPRPRRDPFAPCALSFSQQRLWFLAQFEPDSALYNEPKAVRIRGALNVQALQQALDTIVARHEVLRTTFVAVD